MLNFVGVGVNWNNLFTPVSADDTFSMGYIFVMLIVDSAIGFLVTWYFDNVMPGDFGIPKKLYFPFMVSLAMFLVSFICVLIT